MTSWWFYHLRQRPCEHALAQLLEKCLERGWRAVVEIDDQRQLDALNTALWTYDDAAFLPHGSAADGFAEDQPIYLTLDKDNPNQAAVRFYIGAALPARDQIAALTADYQRLIAIISENSHGEMVKVDQLRDGLKNNAIDVTCWRDNGKEGWSRLP